MLHDVGLLDASVKINGLDALCFADGAVFVIFMWPLCGVIFGLFLKYFTLLRKVSSAMQQTCFLCTGCFLDQRYCIFSPALASTDLLGIGRQGGFSSLSFPDMNVMVGIFPSIF